MLLLRILLLIFFHRPKQLVRCDAEVVGEHFQFYICDKAVTGFDSLNGIFVKIKSKQLNSISDNTLGVLAGHCLSESADIQAADIVAAVRCFVFIQFFSPAQC